MKMNKIKDFFKKVKAFRLFSYLIGRKIKKVDNQVELNQGLIEFYNDEIEKAEATIKDSGDMIESLVKEISYLDKLKEDMNKLK